MLKLCHSWNQPEDRQEFAEVNLPSNHPHSCALVVTEPDDGLTIHSPARPSARLSNSEMLKELPNVLSHLSSEQKAGILTLTNRFSCLFQDVPSRTTVAQYDTDVGHAKPIKQHAYPVNPVKRELMKKEAEYLLQHGLAVPSSSPWSSLCLLETKPGGSPRLITDFRKANAVTNPDSYPLLRVEDCIDNLGTENFVSKLDLLKGYWPVPLAERASLISHDHF